MSIKRKILALCLSAALAATTAGTTAFAADDADPFPLQIASFNKVVLGDGEISDSETLDLLDTPVFYASPAPLTDVTPVALDASAAADSVEEDLPGLLPDEDLGVDIQAEWTSSDPSILEITTYEALPIMATADFKKAGDVDITCDMTVDGIAFSSTLHVTLVDEISKGEFVLNADSYPIEVGGILANGLTAENLDMYGLGDLFMSVPVTEGEDSLIPAPTAEDGILAGFKNGETTTYLLNFSGFDVAIEDESIAGFATYYSYDPTLDPVKELPEGVSEEDATVVYVIEGKKDGTTNITVTYGEKTATAELVVGTGEQAPVDSSDNTEQPEDPQTPEDPGTTTSDPTDTDKTPETPVTGTDTDNTNGNDPAPVTGGNPTTSDVPVALMAVLALSSACVLALCKRRDKN